MQFKNARYLSSYFDVSELPKTDFPEIAFAGRSNVGKSTLINTVLNRKKLALVSKTPGKTRALNYYEVDGKYYFVDLPGYGFARVSKKERYAWEPLIESYLKTSPNLKGVVHVLDSRLGLTDLDYTLVEYSGHIKRNVNARLGLLWVLTKADKLGSQARKERYQEVLSGLGSDPPCLVFFSALNGTGVVEVRRRIMEILTS